MIAMRHTLLAGMGAMAFAGPARAQAAWPERPLRFVIGGAAGGWPSTR